MLLSLLEYYFLYFEYYSFPRSRCLVPLLLGGVTAVGKAWSRIFAMFL